MSKELYDARLKRLYQTDRRFIDEYRQFEDRLRRNERSMFSASLDDHLQSLRQKPISEKYEEKQIMVVLVYHDWVCETKKLEPMNTDSAYVTLPHVLVSYGDLYHYCKMRVEDLGMKAWSQNMICTAILRMLRFVETKKHGDEGMAEAIAEMRSNTRALLSMAQREEDRLNKARPSVEELREQGKMLSLTDLAKVCQKQVCQ